MNFFKSILSDDPTNPNDPHEPSQPSSSATTAEPWTFSTLVKTITTQSESVIEIYCRDLQEFKSGLEKETATFRDIATRVVAELPSEIDGVLKSTAQIISQKTEHDPGDKRSFYRDPDCRRYSFFEAQLRALRNDFNTYCEEVEDKEDFEKWRDGFVLEEKREENEVIHGIYRKVVPELVDDEMFWLRYYYRVYKLKQQEDTRASLVKRAISIDMDEELSWDVDDDDDYVAKESKEGEIDEKGEIKKPEPRKSDDEAEIKRPESSKIDEEEEIMKPESSKIDEKAEIKMPESNIIDDATKLVDKEEVLNKPESSKIDDTTKVVDKEEVLNKPESSKIDDTTKVVDKEEVINKPKSNKSDETAKVVDKKEVIDKPESSKVDKKNEINEEKIVEVDNGGSSKGNDVAIASTKLPEEEDLGWDEIEDVGSGDEKKVVPKSGNPNISSVMKKKLSAADQEDEDLSWDIEDDDEHVPKPSTK